MLIRDRQMRTTPFYVVLGVTTHGERDSLGNWAGDGGQGRPVLAAGLLFS